jgi:predicted nucleic acid-binding protein
MRLVVDSNIVFSTLLNPKSNTGEILMNVQGLDTFDLPFVALALQLDCKLWTGDKKLQVGLESKNVDLITSTQKLINFLP